MHDGFKMAARIPYTKRVPKFYAIASDAFPPFLWATIPEVYDYSPLPDNAAKTEYTFMEFKEGTNLSDVFLELDEEGIDSIMRQFAQLESRIMSVLFPAGGSLYYTKDLEKMAGRKTLPLYDLSFCVGLDTRLHMWCGRRSQLDVDGGPYEITEAVLVAAACMELAYLEKFGRPLQPFQRERRESYDWKEQTSFDHTKNLERYLLIAPSLVPQNPALYNFRMRHPDLQPNNIIVSTSADSNDLKIIALIDWQDTSILPLFLTGIIPGRFQKDNSNQQPTLRKTTWISLETDLQFAPLQLDTIFCTVLS